MAEQTRRHILFVTPHYYPELRFGGPPKRLRAFAKHLVARGHHVAVSSVHSEQRSGMPTTSLDDVEVDFVRWTGPSRKPLIVDLSRLNNRIAAADVVHCFGLYNSICPMAAYAARRHHTPWVLEPMGMFVPRLRSVLSKRLYNATITKWMMNHAAAVVATSEIEARELRAMPLNRKVVIRQNGLDVSEYDNLPLPSIMRERWRIAPTEQLILYLGRISAKKRLIDLLQAFSKLCLKTARLVIAGPVSEPSYRTALQDAIRSLKLKEQVLLRGALYGSDFRAALSAADLFVLPSENENFGNAAAEAVAAGIPVLLTETCGVASLIHGRAGLAVPLGIDSLTEGLRTMLDPTLRVAFMTNPDAVKRDLSWDEPVSQTIALYERIVVEKSKVKSRK